MLDACYRRWYGAMAEIPIWGCKIDREVLRYLDGIRNVALGSLVWRYVSLSVSMKPLALLMPHSSCEVDISGEQTLMCVEI